MFGFEQQIVKDFRASSDKMVERYTELAQENRELRKQIKKSHDELLSDKTNELEMQIRDLKNSMVFNISPLECKTIQNFRMNHSHSNSFVFEEDGDGLISYLSCKCPKCNEEIVMYF